MCERTVDVSPWLLEFVPDYYKTQEMREKAVTVTLGWTLRYVPDKYKMQEMCGEAIMEYPYSLQYVPDWSVT